MENMEKWRSENANPCLTVMHNDVPPFELGLL